MTTEEGTRGLEEVAGWPGVHVAGDDPAAFAAALRSATEQNGRDREVRRERMGERLQWDTLAAQVAEVLTSAVNARRL